MNLFIPDIGFALVTAAVLGLSSVAFSLQYAVSNVLNLAFGSLLTLPAYFTYTVMRATGASIWVAAVAGVLLTGVAALLLNHALIAPFVRRGAGPFAIMVVTFAVSSVLDHALVAIYGPNSFTLSFAGQATLIRVGSFQLSYAAFLTIVIAVVAILALQYILHATRVGTAMRAIVDGRTLARACGVRTSMVSDYAWFLSGCFAGIAGLALVISTGTVNSLIGENFLLYVIPAAFLGGMGSLYGAMIGSVVIAFATVWSGIVIGSQYEVAVALLVLLLVFVFRPVGIIAMPERKWSGA